MPKLANPISNDTLVFYGDCDTIGMNDASASTFSTDHQLHIGATIPEAVA